MPRLFRFATALLVFAVMSGCAAGQKKAVSVRPPDKDDVIALVNGTKLTVEDFRLDSPGGKLEAETKRQVLNDLINNRLVSLAAYHRGFDGGKDLDNRLALYKSNVLPEMLERKVAEGVRVSDSEIPEDAIPDTPKLELYQITTPTREEAEAALAELKGGANFEEVAKRRSKGISAEGGGYIGVVDLGSDLFSAGVKGALNMLDRGQISPIIKTDLGYSIFKVKDKKTAEEVRLEALDGLKAEKKAEKVKKEMAILLERLREKGNVKYNEKLLAGDLSQDWGAEVDGRVIKLAPNLLKSDPDQMHQEPHSDMDVKSVVDSLKRLVDNMLLSGEAQRRGVDKDPAFQRKMEIEKEKMLTQLFLDKGLGSFEPTPEEMKAYYEKNREGFGVRARVRLSRILTKDKDKAEKAAAELKEGKDFAAVAREYSEDKSVLMGGDMGWLLKDVLNPPFPEVLSSMKEGDISPVFQSKYGYEIIRLDGQAGGKVPDFDEVSNTIRERVRLNKKAEAVQKLYDSLHKDARITLNEEVLKRM